MRLLKWLYPGMQVKRWLFLAISGIFFFGVGASLLAIDEASFGVRALSLVFLGFGLYALVTGWRRSVHSLLDVILPVEGRDLVELIYQRRHLERGPRIVAIGGGTGLSTLLHGLKPYTTNLTAIVTMADDGGSSGRLREEFGMVPPGDIRNCLVALADAEPLMQRLFQHRFTGSSALQGHSFGNLFITAMAQITGDFQQAVRASSKVLAIRGHVVPSTCEKVRLAAEHEDGSVTVGESQISQALQPIRRVYLEPANPAPTQEALEAIRHADVIILGPGSLYTSIIPNLLADGMVEALRQSKALKIYVCNVMTQFRETAGFKASDHVQALVAHAGPGIFHVCIVNTTPVPPELLQRYRAEQAFPVEPDAEAIRRLGYQVVTGEVISTVDAVRHDADRLARLIIQLALGRRALSTSRSEGGPRDVSPRTAEPPASAHASV